MDHSHQYGKSINILRFSESKEIIVDNKEIEKIFGHPEIQDRKVAILSLIGAFRSGKSFFLDYCLRFLYANFPSIHNRWEPTRDCFRVDDDWMGSPDEPLTGFSWRSGTKPETIGINIWSDVFLHTMDRTGEKIAILVMDTQGLFDNQSTPTDNSRIFALGTLISSIQVLNLKNQVQEDHLQYLQFANELAQFTLKKKMKMEGKPFQNVTFLIRDWENNEEFHYGTAGGHEYIKDVLTIKPDQSQELKAVRSSILDSFEQVNCCLLPHPGKKAIGNPKYNGNWSGMDEDFKNHLKKLIGHLLHPDKLIMGKIIESRNILNWFKIIQLDIFPNVEKICENFMVPRFDSGLERYHRASIKFENKFKFQAQNLHKHEEKLHEINLEKLKKIQEEREIELEKARAQHQLMMDQFEKEMEDRKREIEQHLNTAKIREEREIEFEKERVIRQLKKEMEDRKREFGQYMYTTAKLMAGEMRNEPKKTERNSSKLKFDCKENQDLLHFQSLIDKLNKI
ncbi:atlastin-like [Chironomus tepperi]|uniref:atlastin-like n=1 Tax=Chironomus tepperi TaxID=113505 RepID=UPI00391F895F